MKTKQTQKTKGSRLLRCILLPASGFLLAMVLALPAWAQTQTLVLTEPGTHTFTPPVGVTRITVEAWGAGGRGGRITYPGGDAGGGGGGGAYSRRTPVLVTYGTNYTVVVGAGGNDNNINGGDSYFYDPVNGNVVVAKGGNGVPDNNPSSAQGGQASSGIGTFRYSGGNGAIGDGTYGDPNSYGGGGGSSAGTAANGNNATGRLGAIAPAGGGNGGNGGLLGPVNQKGNPGSPGLPPGGGGGGARRNTVYGNITQAGGFGAPGKVVISWTPCPVITATANKTDIKCYESTAPADRGTIIISASGGQPPYLYSINNGQTWQASGTFTNLPEGSYKIRVMDNNGCTSPEIP